MTVHSAWRESAESVIDVIGWSSSIDGIVPGACSCGSPSSDEYVIEYVQISRPEIATSSAELTALKS
jgi:hypothetical protein